MKEFETKELLLREFKKEDVEEAYESWINTKMLEDIIGFEPEENVVVAKMLINAFINETKWGEPKWVIQEKTTGKLIGYVGIREISINNKICRVMFNITDYNSTGKEYVKEALLKVCNYLLESDFDVVYSKIYNSSSEVAEIKKSILEEIGMKKGKSNNKIIKKEIKNSKNFTIFSLDKKDEEKDEKKCS